jgi:hypothetical protein
MCGSGTLLVRLLNYPTLKQLSLWDFLLFYLRQWGYFCGICIRLASVQFELEPGSRFWDLTRLLERLLGTV